VVQIRPRAPAKILLLLHGFDLPKFNKSGEVL